jgi:colanic acid biosynthesis glycosyl transferase WcaI
LDGGQGLKLIFVNRYFYPDISATSQLLTDLALQLAADGRDVHVVASRQRYEAPHAHLTGEELVGQVRVHRVWTTRFGRSQLVGRAIDYATFYASCGLRLLILTSRGDVLVALTDPPLISIVAGWVAKVRGASLINWIQDLFPEVAARLGVKMLTGPIGHFAVALRNRSLRSARTNVALSQHMADVLVDVAGPVSAIVIPNWTDGRAVKPVPRDVNPLRVEWNLRDRFVVGYSGNFGRAHEFATILDACQALSADPGVVFLFIGDGKQRRWLEEHAHARNLSNLLFRPYQPREMLSLSLSAPDVHLVTLLPHLEGLVVPSKFYGIAAAGRPTIYIGDPDGEIGATISREGCGIAVRSGNGQALVEAISALARDGKRTEAMGAQARQLFESQFDFPVACAKWRRVL